MNIHVKRMGGETGDDLSRLLLSSLSLSLSLCLLSVLLNSYYRVSSDFRSVPLRLFAS